MNRITSVAAFACVLPLVLARAQEPTAKQLDWLRAHAIALKTGQPEEDLADLRPLRDLIGSARIVALGEGTHGTREFFQMKHRVTEYLASELGFTIFSMEANMPEAYRVNDFVREGRGDPGALLAGMYFWTWNTQEVLDMILWMRRFNQSGKGVIEFTGFDMQTPDVAANIVRAYVEPLDAEFAGQVVKTYAEVKQSVSAGAGAGFGVATATFPVAAARGKRIRLGGWIKSREITRGWAGLWWRVDGESGILVFDNMAKRGVTGTTEWKRYEIELPVADNATNINFGALHTGDGTAWFDDLSIEIDGAPYADELPADLDFESGTARGFFTGGAGYRVEVDAGQAHSGTRSLRMTHPGQASQPTEESKLSARDAARLCRQIVTQLEQQREAYERKSSAKDFAWALQNARVVSQCYDMQAGELQRDEAMARNVRWILEQAPPDAKIVLWAHNGHVMTHKPLFGSGSMGATLRRWYGDKLVVLGFAANTGRYTAVAQNQGLTSDNELHAATPGCAEYWFHQTGLPRFILDLRQAAADDPASSWLTRPVKFRSIGAMALEEQFHPLSLTQVFDALVYIDETAPSRPLKN